MWPMSKTSTSWPLAASSCSVAHHDDLLLSRPLMRLAGESARIRNDNIMMTATKEKKKKRIHLMKWQGQPWTSFFATNQQFRWPITQFPDYECEVHVPGKYRRATLSPLLMAVWHDTVLRFRWNCNFRLLLLLPHSARV